MSCGTPLDVERQHAGPLTELDQLAVGPGAGGEPLRTDMERLEQVGLAGAIVARDEDDTRTQLEVEGRVGAVVPEGDVPDDQPASLIGMIRYV